MDYHEFCDRSGDNVTEDEYEMILEVYMYHPDIRDVSVMLEYWKKNGKMKGIEKALPLCRSIRRLGESNVDLTRRVNSATATIDELTAKVEEQARIIGMYRKMVTCENLAAQLTREQIEKALAQEVA